MAEEERQLKTRKGFWLTISTDGAEARLQLVRDEWEGATVLTKDIYDILSKAGIAYGIQKEAVEELAETHCDYKPKIVALGDKLQIGNDAEIEYLFETSLKKKPTVDEIGNVDYKDLNYIQNAHTGQVLVRKKPATEGTPGKSVFGKEIKARNGRDKRLPRGANAELSDNQLELVAAIDGSIVFKSDSVSVQPSQDITGCVDSSTGNIMIAGSLKVYKDICADFKVETGGDLEVGGNVEDGVVIAGGSVLIRGGFFGGGKGTLDADGTVSIKYVENQKIRTNGPVNFNGNVINADIYSGEEVIVQGRTHMIVGGNVAARYLIRAANLGNDASVPTHVHVGYDIKIMTRLKEVNSELSRLAEDEKRVKTALVQLYKLELGGNLPPEKKKVLVKLKEFTADIPTQLEALQKEHVQLKQQLDELCGARIVVENRVYPGVVIHFGPIYKEILEPVSNGCIFEVVDGVILRSSFNREKEEILVKERQKKIRDQQSTAKPESVDTKK